MWGKKEMNIHDKEIVGFLYKKNDQLLVLLSSDENNIFFNSVIFFHFNNVSDQNIIFDIYEWGKEDIPNETKAPIKETPKPQSTTLDNGVESSQDDAVLNRIDEISKAKVITDEKAEPIEKQIQKSNIKPAKVEDDISELARDNDEFVDLESIKIAKDSELVTMLVFDDVDSIVGVDERVYGPFRPQDLVVLPKINAKIFVKNHKARFVKI